MKKIYLTFLLIAPLMTSGQEMLTVNDQPKQKVQGFKMYPNPAYGEEIHITTATNGNKKITVFDVFGDVVLREQITTNTLNISRLVAGVYVLQVSENNRTMTRKLVVK